MSAQPNVCLKAVLPIFVEISKVVIIIYFLTCFQLPFCFENLNAKIKWYGTFKESQIAEIFFTDIPLTEFQFTESTFTETDFLSNNNLPKRKVIELLFY